MVQILLAANIKQGITIFGVEGTYSGSGASLQTKSVNPTESEQEVTPDSGYDRLSKVTVGAIDSDYVGSGISRRSNSDLSFSGGSFTGPAGYYENSLSKNISVGSVPTPSINVSNTGLITATATVPTSCWITADSASATEQLEVKDSTDLTVSGATVSVPAGYYASAASKSVSSGSATGPTSLSGSSATITTGTNTITLTKTGVTTTPTVSAGYISSATASTATVALTASVTVDPTPTVSGATVTIPAGYYSAQTTKSVATGTVTAPSSISGTSSALTYNTQNNTLTLTKTVSVTPSVTTAGYVSSGTAGNSSVSLTGTVSTIYPTRTITPTTTNITIASGSYNAGEQTIVGDANLVAGNIKSGTSIFGVTGSYSGLDTSDATASATDIVDGKTAYVDGRKVEGSLVIQKYYTGSSAPSSSLGNNGDIYFQS